MAKCWAIACLPDGPLLAEEINDYCSREDAIETQQILEYEFGYVAILDFFETED